EARRAQDQPRGLEDGDTAFSESLRWDVFQSGHGRLLGSESCSHKHFEKHRGGAGIPSPPLGTSRSPPVRTGMPADLVCVLRFTRPQPPSSERQRRRCGFWLSYGTRRVRRSAQTAYGPHLRRRFGPHATACRADAREYCRQGSARRQTASRQGACPPSRGRFAKIRLLSCVPWMESLFGNYITYLGDEIITGFRHYCSAAASLASLASAFGAGLAFFGRGGGVAAAFLPSVRISVIRTRVYSGRWPRWRREFLRRRFLKAMTFGPRPCSSTSPATLAPATVGLPSVGVSPPTTSTSPNSTTSPGLPATFAICSLSSRAT